MAIRILESSFVQLGDSEGRLCSQLSFPFCRLREEQLYPTFNPLPLVILTWLVERNTQLQLRNTQLECKEIKRKLEEKVNALESPSMMQISGVYTWKICGFEEIMGQAKSGKKTEINSPPFNDHGYKFGIVLQPNKTLFFSGDTCVFVRFFLMKGEYDAVLSWPLPNTKVTITLIDQQEDPRQRVNVDRSFTTQDVRFKNCFRRVENDGNKYPADLLIITLDNITERRYIVDDTIFIQVHIAPAR